MDIGLREHSIPQPNYNKVLTLLWIDKEIDTFRFGHKDEEEEQDEGIDLDHFTPDGKRWRW